MDDKDSRCVESASVATESNLLLVDSERIRWRLSTGVVSVPTAHPP